MMTTARVLVCCFGLGQLAAEAGAAIKTTPGELVIESRTVKKLVEYSTGPLEYGLKS